MPSRPHWEVLGPLTAPFSCHAVHLEIISPKSNAGTVRASLMPSLLDSPSLTGLHQGHPWHFRARFVGELRLGHSDPRLGLLAGPKQNQAGLLKTRRQVEGKRSAGLGARSLAHPWTAMAWALLGVPPGILTNLSAQEVLLVLKLPPLPGAALQSR